MGPRRRLVAQAFLPVLACAATLAGQDHVGHPLPEYVTGDECLFCHRVQVADTWQQNPHARTVRPISVEQDKHGFPPDVTDVLGAERISVVSSKQDTGNSRSYR